MTVWDDKLTGFSAWWAERYEADPNHVKGTRPQLSRCKRCHMSVWHATKHAANVHGDDVQVLPTSPENAANGMSSDDQGRLVQV